MLDVPGPELEQAVYVPHDAFGALEHVIRCTRSTMSHACDVMFGAAQSPFVYITLTFEHGLLPQWNSVIRDTRDWIDRMIARTCALPSPAYRRGQ